MIFENHNGISHVVFCFRLSTCQKTDTCNIVTRVNGIYRGYLLFLGEYQIYFIEYVENISYSTSA